jgi:peptidoglycan/LPS O-acetylase OafA/YrhL
MASAHPGVKYRPDIDGLRALAILPVVWFHSNLPGVPGGFTGVDTFFVISGYLITLIIHREVQAGSFSFARFYERRVRRIAPALLLVLLAMTGVAYALLLPYELERYGAAGLAALAMVSNIFFWRTGGYFALADDITPLLHTWSLGVEEQFYLLFPAVLLAAQRHRRTKLGIPAILVGSLLLCLVLTARSPAAAFYLLPTRGWELMVGAALAVGLVAVPERLRALAGISGLVLLAAAAIMISGEDAFPGWRALIPTIGAALIIGAGPAGPAAQLLSAPPLVYLGRISYSLYLWHWPVFVFMRHWRADSTLPATWSLAGIAGAVVLAILSYHLVEQPARDRRRSFRKLLLVCAAAATMLIIALAAAIVGRGLPQRLPQNVVRLASAHDAYAPLAHVCTDIGIDAALQRCRIGPRGRPTVVLWGDSHAAAISEAVGMALARPGLLLSAGACPPTAGWTDPRLKGRDPEICRDFTGQAIRLIEGDPTIDTVVLSAFWAKYDASSGEHFWRSVQQLADRLNGRGKRVVLVAGVPDPGQDVPWASAIRARHRRPALSLTCQKAKVPLRNVLIADVSSGFCGRDPSMLFTDSNHVSRAAGLQIVAPAISQALNVSNRTH